MGYAPQMRALLDYWDREPRKDPLTELRVWHDQMETGADNNVLSQCPNARSDCWTDSQAFTLASPDLMVYLQREHLAYALFCEFWMQDAITATEAETTFNEATTHRGKAANLQHVLN